MSFITYLLGCSIDKGCNLSLSINTESLLSTQTGKLDINRTDLLLHNILQDLHSHLLSIGEGDFGFVLVLEGVLGGFGTGTDGFSLVLGEGSGRVGEEPKMKGLA